MNSFIKLVIGVFFLLWSSLEAHGEHLPPSGKYTTVIDFPDTFREGVAQAFSYRSDSVELNGTATWNALRRDLTIKGAYTSHQNLDTGINLAYQIYDPKNQLILKEGERSPFTRGNSPETSVAQFNYTIDLQSFELPKKTRSITVQFNYVKEFEYWADQKFPEIELPALEIVGIEIKDPIKVRFSWIPWLAPKNVRTFSYHLFRVDPSLDSAVNYNPSVEGYFLDDRLRRENKRYELSPEDLGHTKGLIAEMRFNKIGRVNRRLGFVLPGVRWHNRNPDSYTSTWVLPIWAYSAIALASLGIFSIVLHLASKARHKMARIAGRAAAGILLLLFLLEFSTPLLPFFLASFAALFVSQKCVQIKYAVYWILVLAIISLDFIWASIQGHSTFHIYGFLYTLFLVPLFVAPITLFRKTWLVLLVGNLLLVIASSYYITISLYYEFFNDYPTWNLLTYASQGLDVADSIFSLVGEQHIIAGIAMLFFFIALNTAPLLNRPINAESIHEQLR